MVGDDVLHAERSLEDRADEVLGDSRLHRLLEVVDVGLRRRVGQDLAGAR